MQFERHQIKAVKRSDDLVIVIGKNSFAEETIECHKKSDIQWDIIKDGITLDSCVTAQGAANIAFFELWG